jgi:hypothetical protein
LELIGPVGIASRNDWLGLGDRTAPNKAADAMAVLASFNNEQFVFFILVLFGG